MSNLSLLEYIRIKLHLVPRRERARLLRGLRPRLSPQALVAAKGWLLSVLAVAAAFGYYGMLQRRVAGLVAEQLLAPQPPSLVVASSSAPAPRLPGIPSGSRKRRELRERLFTPEANERIQSLHDRLQDRYGDGIYRAELKPRAVGLAMSRYVGELLRGRTTLTPRDWARRRMTPEALDRIVAEAESAARPFSQMAIGDLQGDGPTSTFQVEGRVEMGQARVAPSMSETSPDE